VREAERATAEVEAILDSIQESTSLGLGYFDRDFRAIRLNAMLAAVHGGTVEDQIGLTIEEGVPELWPRIEPIYRKVIETGEPVVGVEVSGVTASDPGREHWWLSNLYPVKVAGSLIGFSVVVVDITDRKQLELSQVALTRAVVDALAYTVELRDPYTAGHQERVAELATSLAERLGRSRGEIASIDLAARIHDLGKILVPAEILSRPGHLSDVEMKLAQAHALAGSDILERAHFPEDVCQMVLQHHERLDGSGYPSGLAGDEICAGARIIAVVDVFDAMVGMRPYRAALQASVALKELTEGAGTLYDPEAVAALVQLVGEGRFGLENGQTAVELGFY